MKNCLDSSRAVEAFDVGPPCDSTTSGGRSPVGPSKSALTGTETTVTNPDGTTTTTSSGGVLAMRADGMGWGQIAKELGFNLGTLVSASNGNGKSQATARTAKAEKVEKAAKADRPERVAKVDRPARPERIERPERPERPQRPDKPERGGRP